MLFTFYEKAGAYMRKTPHFSERFISVLLTIALTLCLAGCGGSGAGIKFEVVSAIDPASVTEADGYTRFTAVGTNGTTIHFQGIGVTVEEGSIVMVHGGYSLLIS